MRARAQKKRKKVSKDEDATRAARRAAPQPAAEVAAGRPAPDPEQPPVVAAVLMPSVGLEVPPEELAVVVSAIASGGATTPAPEADAPAAAPQETPADPPPPPSRRTFTLPYDQQDATPPPLAPPRAETTTRTDAADDAAWRAPDEARLLVQTPRRLFLYWRFARDPRELLREALGPVAERMSPAVRLVDVASGEEGEAAPAEGSDYWFDVLPGRLLRADVGFRGEGLPFVRLISSNTVETPAVGVSRVEDEAPEFRVPEQDFGRVLEATGFAADEWREKSARRGATDQSADPAEPFGPPRREATRNDEPLRPRATSDPRLPTSSPRDGGHFSNTRGGGELF